MFLVKIAALIVFLAVAIPFVAGDSAVGELLRAAWADVAGFCTRQPDACAEGAALARDAGAIIADTLSDLGAPSNPGTLTEGDRALAPAVTHAPAPHEAFAGHGTATTP